MRIPKDRNEAKSITKKVASGVVGAICQFHPISAGIWTLWQEQQTAKWRYRVEEFIIYVEGEKFGKDLFEEEGFQDGLALAFQAFIQQRNERKREYIKRIFIGFSTSLDKEKFELERFFDVIEKISEEHVSILNQLSKKELIPLVSENIFQKKIDTIFYSNSKYLESLGLVYVEFYSEVIMEDEVHFDYEGGLVAETHPTGKQIAKLDTRETLVFSYFGKNFMEFIFKEFYK